MTSRDSSTRPGSAGADALVAHVADQRTLRPDPPVRTVEEFALFLAQVEAVVGADARPRPPTVGRFRL
jgi:hypothetical protein